jgi:hypothetical protein
MYVKYMSRDLIIQGRQLTACDIETIRRLIDLHSDWNRSRLSKELCNLWHWHTDKGLLKDMACRTMLRKLEQKGFITLPVARREGPRKKITMDVPHSRDVIISKLNDLAPLQVITVKTQRHFNGLFHCLLSRYHYLGYRGHVGEHMKYLVLDRHGRPLSCVLFGSAAWKTTPRDEFIGWNQIARRQNLRFVTNNTRFLILPWVRVPHLASFILGACLKRLRKDWQRDYGHDLCLVETFVDRSRFKATCYRAANFRCIGQTKGRSRQDRLHRMQVPIKDILVYPLVHDFAQKLCSRSLRRQETLHPATERPTPHVTCSVC